MKMSLNVQFFCVNGVVGKNMLYRSRVAPVALYVSGWYTILENQLNWMMVCVSFVNNLLQSLHFPSEIQSMSRP